MGLLSKIFSKGDNSNKDPLFDQVTSIVPVANTLAISSFTTFLDKHQILSEVDTNDWDFFYTVAAVSYALTGLANHVASEERYAKLCETLSQEIQKWNKNAEYAMGDLASLLNKTWQNAQHLENEDATKLLASCLGSWCLVNFEIEVTNDNPSPLATEIGFTIIMSFTDWWKGK